MIETLEQAEAYLDGLINRERDVRYAYRRLDLTPIRELLGRVGDPHVHLPVIHVAGSKGKGSTCLFAEAVMQAGGLRTGTFTSPHLERWTERFRIDAAPVAGDELARVVERLRPHVDAVRAEAPDKPPSFFDATTAAALILFAEAAVDWVLLEVGLGGRLDSTNVVTPAVSVVTSIELEHTDKLGHTLAAIAAEKAGIIKPGVPVVCGDLPDEAIEVVRDRAAEAGSRLYESGRAFSFERRGGTLAYRGLETKLEVDLAVLGDHQAQNAALALAAIEVSGALDAGALGRAAREGLPGTRLPGRVERWPGDPSILVDAAHTRASAASLASVLAEASPSGAILVLSLSADKDARAVLECLLPRARRVITTRAEPTRSMDPAELARRIADLAPELPCEVVAEPAKALEIALAGRSGAGGQAAAELVCCAGSVYLAGAVRRALRTLRPVDVA